MSWLHFKNLSCFIEKSSLETPTCTQWLLIWGLAKCLSNGAGFASFLFTVLLGCQHSVFSATCRNLQQSLTSVQLRWVYTLVWQGKIICTLTALLSSEILQVLIKSCSLLFQMMNGNISVTAAVLVKQLFASLVTFQLWGSWNTTDLSGSVSNNGEVAVCWMKNSSGIWAVQRRLLVHQGSFIPPFLRHLHCHQYLNPNLPLMSLAVHLYQ